jgi:hypothetical protein
MGYQRVTGNEGPSPLLKKHLENDARPKRPKQNVTAIPAKLKKTIKRGDRITLADIKARHKVLQHREKGG